MPVTAIIQARMGSTRLPGKILKPLGGKPVLEHVIERTSRARNIDKVIVATTGNAVDDLVDEFCGYRGVDCFRGSEADVLDRYYECAITHNGDPVVRITADCPVIDPEIIDEVLTGYFAGKYDLYGLGGEFPDGLDCAAISMGALEAAWREASLPSEREHVCPFIAKHPQRFKVGCLEKFTGLSSHRWTLDEPEDYEFLKSIFDRLYWDGELFLTGDILGLLEKEPELLRINSGIVRNAGYLKSLEEDKSVTAAAQYFKGTQP